jgi:hypothetical protein
MTDNNQKPIRIVFTFEKNKETGATEILLIDVGTHKEVY